MPPARGGAGPCATFANIVPPQVIVDIPGPGGGRPGARQLGRVVDGTRRLSGRSVAVRVQLQGPGGTPGQSNHRSETMAHAMFQDAAKPNDNSGDLKASPVRHSKPFVVLRRRESVGIFHLLVLHVPTRP